jgi:hypothetical protein
MDSATGTIGQIGLVSHYGGEKVILESAQRNFQLILWNQSGKACEVGPKADGETWFWCLQYFRRVFDAVYNSVIMVVKK